MVLSIVRDSVLLEGNSAILSPFAVIRYRVGSSYNAILMMILSLLLNLVCSQQIDGVMCNSISKPFVLFKV